MSRTDLYTCPHRPSIHRRPRSAGLGQAAALGLGTLMLAGQVAAQSTFAPSTSEYNWSTTVQQMHVSAVHSRGILGQGVIVGLLDTGLNLANPEFANNPRVLTPYNAVDGSTDVTDSLNHGTHVAGIIGAGANGSGMYGVAPLASLLEIKVFNGGTASATNINTGLDYAISRGARVINMSFGTTTPLGDAGLRRAAATNQAVLVVAAGNEGTRNPNWPGRYARESWAAGTMLVVGAVDSNNRIASFSNRAGDTAQFYLVAPGVNILSSYGTGYGYMSGTSMAAPAVSGAAALIIGYWPYLRASQVAAILLNTADDLGAPGVDAVYGHGLLDINRALSPIGKYTYRAANGYTVTVPLSVQGVASRQPPAVTPSAFGGVQTQVFDDYGRNFTSDEGQSLRVHTVLTSDMVMGRGDDGGNMGQHTGLGGSRWTWWTAQPVNTLAKAAPQGVMSPLSAGISPQQEWTPSTQRMHGAMQWASREGWGLSLGDGGLSAAALGVMASDVGRSLSDGGAAQVLASPLASFSPLHRFGVVSLPIGTPGGQQGWRTQARLAALQPDTSSLIRSAQGSVVLAEVSAEHADGVVNVSLGQLQEHGLLGGYSNPAMGLDTVHHTVGVSVSTAWRWTPHWSTLASWSQTQTAAPQASGLLMSGTRVRADAMGAGLVGQDLWQAGDRLGVAWLAPLKACNGQYQYSVVTGVDDAGQPIYGQQTVHLGGGAREWQLDTRYQWRTSPASTWSAALTWRVNPDHDASAPDQWAGGVRYQRAF